MKDLKDLKDIQEIRDQIDKIDHQILELFRDRDSCTREIIRFKSDRAGVIAKNRQAELIASRRRWAEELNLDPGLFEKVFRMLIKSNIKKQLEMLRQQESYVFK